LILKYKSGKDQLNSIKLFFYNIIKPVFLCDSLIDIYKGNATRFKNIDGSSNDSSLFLLNTCQDYLNKMQIEVDFKLHHNDGSVYIFEDDTENNSNTTFTLNSIKIYQTIHILSIFKVFIENTAVFDMNPSKFVSGFQIYLDNKNTTKHESMFIWVLNHPPNLDNLSIK